MALILILFFFLFFAPLTAWAYIDPGFGGYLIGSIVSSVVAACAFVSAGVIYFFRTLIRKWLGPIWQKCGWLCVILGSNALGVLLYYFFHQSLFLFVLQVWAFFDACFDKFNGSLVVYLLLFTLIIISAFAIFYWLRFQKQRRGVALSILCLGNIALGAFLFQNISKIPVMPTHLSTARIIDAARMFKGYNFYDGKLIDANGRVIKEWPGNLGAIDQNGDFYAGQDSSWGRYQWDGQAIWEKPFSIHHELYLSPKGSIFTFIAEPHEYNDYHVDFDVILEYDKNGNELQRYSLWDHLQEFKPYHATFRIDVAAPAFLRPLSYLWQNLFNQGTYDYFHINSFDMLPPNPLEAKNPTFRRGNWLISIFHGSMVFILDQDTKKILWHAVGNEIEGGLQGQHSASMLPDGNILLFENGIDRFASRILIINPLTLKIVWEYRHPGFSSPHQGYVQALPNGNFLVTESEKGHVFELTPDKEIVWEYYNTQGKDGNIYRMVRYPKEMINGFLQNNK